MSSEPTNLPKPTSTPPGDAAAPPLSEHSEISDRAATAPTKASGNSAIPVFGKALVYGAYLALGIAVVGGVVGFLVDGWTGLVSALIGTALAAFFLGLTAGSIVIANRFSGSPLFGAIFFAVVLGTWILKFVIFLVLVVVLKDQPWVNTLVLFLSIVAGVLGSLAVDVLVMLRSKLPYVSDATLPHS